MNSISVRSTASNSPSTGTRNWRCSRCLAKLGTWSGGDFIIKQRQSLYRFREPVSEIEATCRSCGQTNKMNTSV